MVDHLGGGVRSGAQVVDHSRRDVENACASGGPLEERMPTYRTIERGLSLETEKVKGSRFIARVEKVTDEAEVDAVLAEVQEAYPDASHHCWAWRLCGGRSRSSDDGEPRGSAGPPILARVESAELYDVVVVVTRYFGGTKLGVGGLIRAYGGAAAEALAGVEVVEVASTTDVVVTFGYDDTGAVQGAVAAAGAEVVDAEYGVEARLVVRVVEEVAEDLRRALVDRTGGRAVVGAFELPLERPGPV